MKSPEFSLHVQCYSLKSDSFCFVNKLTEILVLFRAFPLFQIHSHTLPCPKTKKRKYKPRTKFHCHSNKEIETQAASEQAFWLEIAHALSIERFLYDLEVLEKWFSTVRVHYLFYHGIDEKIKSWTRCFSAK